MIPVALKSLLLVATANWSLEVTLPTLSWNNRYSKSVEVWTLSFTGAFCFYALYVSTESQTNVNLHFWTLSRLSSNNT